MRWLYTGLFILLLPLVLLRLYWRGIKAPDYRERWRERLAIYPAHEEVQRVIWFHAVSVGEAEALFPLVRRFQDKFPDRPILVTTTTPTGSSRIRTVLGDVVDHVYLPYDIPFIVERFLRQFRPCLAVIMEKEIWPNLFARCAQHKIPLFIINARLSARSARGYHKIPALVRPALRQVTAVLTQTEDDSRRFIAIGAEPGKTHVVGNLKFDVAVAADQILAGRDLKNGSFTGRFVWLAASTHKGEDEIFLDLYGRLKQQIPGLLLIIVPRHPERFQQVRRLAEKKRLQTVMRSTRAHCDAATDVYIADTMGELKMLFAAADIAFVGGSLVPVGGHNILEPIAVGVPVLFGPYMENFQEIAETVLSAQAALQCQNKETIAEAVLRLYQEPASRQALVKQGELFLQLNQGATERICAVLADYL